MRSWGRCLIGERMAEARHHHRCDRNLKSLVVRLRVRVDLEFDAVGGQLRTERADVALDAGVARLPRITRHRPRRFGKTDHCAEQYQQVGYAPERTSRIAQGDLGTPLKWEI